MQRCALFSELSANQLFHLLEGAEPRELGVGDPLVEAGQKAGQLFVLLRGQLEARSEELLIREYAPVTCFGETSVANRSNYPFTVRARTEASLLAVSGKRFEHLLRSSVSFRRAICNCSYESPSLEALRAAREAEHAEVVAFVGAQGLPIAPLAELLAQALGDYGDRVLVLRVDPQQRSLVSGDLASGAAVAHASITAKAERLFASTRFRRLVPDFDYVFVDLEGLAAERRAAFMGHVDKLVHLYEGEPPVSPERPPHGAYMPTLLMPPKGGPQAIPVGACRLRLEMGDLLAAGGRLGALNVANRAMMGRFARGLSDRTVGVALGGGGAWGYAHVLLLDQMLERGIPVDVVSGSSFGSVVGAFFAARGRAGLAELIELGPRVRNATRLAILNTEFVARFIERQLGPLRLEELDLAYLPIATGVADAGVKVIRRSTVAEAVRASSSFPGIFSATLNGGARVVDGGIGSNVPEAPVFAEGADFVVASNVVPPPPATQTQPQRFRGKWGQRLNESNPFLRLDDLVRSAFILMHAAGANEADMADVLFDIGPLEFLPTQFHKAKEIIAAVRPQILRSVETIDARWRLKAR